MNNYTINHERTSYIWDLGYWRLNRTLQNCLGFNSQCEDGFCSSETKHDRRTVPRPKLFVSKRRLQKQRPLRPKMSWVRFPVKVVSVAWKLSTIQEWCQNQSCSFRWGSYRNKFCNPEKLSWIWFPVKMVSVVQRRRMIEERCQNHSCFFRRGDYRNKGLNPKKLSWVRFLVKFFSVARKLSTIDERRQDRSCFGEEITGTKATNTKNSWVRVLTRMVSVARKLSTIERRKEQNCLFQRGDYRN
jgi:hypothetical protein